MCADQEKEKAKLSEGESSTKKTDSNQKPEKGNDVTDKAAAASAATGTDDEVGQQEQVTESKSSTLEGQLLLLTIYRVRQKGTTMKDAVDNGLTTGL